MRDRFRIPLAIILVSVFMLPLISVPAAVSAEETEEQRIERINREIAEKGGQWTAGKTWPGSLSKEERAKLLGYNPSAAPDPRNTVRFVPAGNAADLPSQFDWRALGGVTPVTNQGGCGSCWAFAAVAQLESFVKIYDSRLLDLSEQAVIDCNPHGADCGGGWIESPDS